MFAYNHEDKKKLLEKIRKKRNPNLANESFIQGQETNQIISSKGREDVLFSFEETLQAEANVI